MDILTQLGTEIIETFQGLWQAFQDFLPEFIVAIIVLIIGWIIAIVLGKFAREIIKAVKIDQILEKIGLKKITDRANVKLDSGKLVEELVKWFIILAFVLVAVDIVNLQEVSSLLGTILLYIPRVIIAVLMMLAGILIANIMEKTVTASVDAARLNSAKMLGRMTRWFILVFALLIAISTLKLGDFADILITGIVAAFALAFGLAGKDLASDALKKLKEDMKD